MASNIVTPVVVIIGVGGIGAAAARRLGSGRLLVLADYEPGQLESAASLLRQEGYKVHTQSVDIRDAASVAMLARDASSLGRIQTVVHTAGASPPKAPAKLIYDVNLLGTAHVIDSFQPLMPSGSSMVCISSSAAHFGNDIPAGEERHFCTAPPDRLIDTPLVNLASDDNGKAYRLSKKANLLRVQAAAAAYGARGARINVVSPGMVATPMGQDVLDGPNGDRARNLIAASPIKRIGTPNDIAEAVAFLAGPSASYITGAELLVDGGSTASVLRGY